jgi:hypothetical protein
VTAPLLFTFYYWSTRAVSAVDEDDVELLSRPDSKGGRLQRIVLELLREHEQAGAIPTSARFLFYELVQRGVLSKEKTGAQRPDQPLKPGSDASP